MREAERHMALRVRPGAHGLLRIVLAHGHDEDIRDRLAVEQKREGQLSAGLDCIGTLARHELECEAEGNVEHMRWSGGCSSRSVEERLGATIETLAAGSGRLPPLLPLFNDLFESLVSEVILKLRRLERNGIWIALVADPVQSAIGDEHDAC